MIKKNIEKYSLPLLVEFMPHHIDNKRGMLRDFYFSARPTHPYTRQFLERYVEFWRKDTDGIYSKWGGSADVVGSTDEEVRRFTRRIVRFNERMHLYPNTLWVRIMATAKDPFCRLCAKGVHCDEFRINEDVSDAEEDTALGIYKDINTILPGAATLRPTRRPNKVAVETSWGAIKSYWEAWNGADLGRDRRRSG